MDSFPVLSPVLSPSPMDKHLPFLQSRLSQETSIVIPNWISWTITFSSIVSEVNKTLPPAPLLPQHNPPVLMSMMMELLMVETIISSLGSCLCRGEGKALTNVPCYC